MKKEAFFEVLGQLDDDIVEEARTAAAKNADGKSRTPGWLKWGAMAACLAVAAALGVPYLFDIFGLKDGPGQSDYLPPLNIIEYNGAYYEIIDTANTETLDAYRLPHQITADMVGSSLGSGLDLDGKKTKQVLYQYAPYADAAAASGQGRERAQRAVYVAEDGGSYSFALFCNFISLDSNAHTEAGEMFAVYGVDQAEDIADITIGTKHVSDSARIREIFDNLYYSVSMGGDDYQAAFFNGMSEEDQQALSIELADSMIEIRMTTTEGVAINHLNYYPTINYVSWALNYYQLDSPLQ